MPRWTHQHDATDGYFNQGKKLSFQHIPTGKQVHFKAFLTDYTDSFKTKWNSTEVYGRNDAIQTFQGTQRTISLGFSIPASDVAESYTNLDKCSLLMRMLYPSYESLQGSTSIAKAPLLRLKFLNLISKGSASGDVSGTGLLGTVGGFTFAPDIDAGFIDWSSNNQPGTLAPKVIKISFEFTVLHEEDLGWDLEGNWRGDYEGGSYFPYVDARSGASRPVDGDHPSPSPPPPAHPCDTDGYSDECYAAMAEALGL